MDNNQKQIQIILRKSPIGYSKDQKETVKILGLNKLNQSTLKPDNPAIRGMIEKVKHLVEFKEV